MKKIKSILLGAVATMALASCSSDYLDTEYTRYLDESQASVVAKSNPDALLNGIWSYMVAFDPMGEDQSAHDIFGYMAILHASDLGSNDIALEGLTWFNYDYLFDNRMATYRRTINTYSFLYTLVGKANTIIASFPTEPTTTGEKGLLGQALALRGYAYGLLIQIFQNPTALDGSLAVERPGVPLIYTSADGFTDDEIAKFKGRNTVGLVLAQAQKDLERSVVLLDGYDRSNKNFIDQNVANGLLARVYLVSQEWEKAANAAKAARAGYEPMSKSALYDGFLSVDNEEWMWGFKVTSETSTTYASFFSHISSYEGGYAGLGYSVRCIDAKLYGQIPDDDARKAWFNGKDGDPNQSMPAAQVPYANLKFGSDDDFTEDYVYMRAAEMYLIEAEALVRTGKADEAATVLGELVKTRQPSWEKSTVTLDDVILQRRIELWGEGFAGLDVKRLNTPIARKYEGSNHSTGCDLEIPAGAPEFTYQIPQREINENTLISEADQNE